MSATAIYTASGWKPLWSMSPVTRDTLQLNHQGWWMKDTTARRAFEDEQVNRINSQNVMPIKETTP